MHGGNLPRVQPRFPVPRHRRLRPAPQTSQQRRRAHPLQHLLSLRQVRPPILSIHHDLCGSAQGFEDNPRLSRGTAPLFTPRDGACHLESYNGNGTHRVALTTAAATARLSAPRRSVPALQARRRSADTDTGRPSRGVGAVPSPRPLCDPRPPVTRARQRPPTDRVAGASAPLCCKKPGAGASIGWGEWITPSRVSPAPPRLDQRSRAMMMIQPLTLSPAHLHPATRPLHVSTNSPLSPRCCYSTSRQRLPPVGAGVSLPAWRGASTASPPIAPVAAQRARQRATSAKAAAHRCAPCLPHAAWPDCRTQASAPLRTTGRWP